ncbi:MAG TPA: DNA gyrase subunit A, partial [Syntrophobacteraceae bacterium]|nr:DNA gyrase subunit A [Syntrophobacteraceae bacterium]
GIVKKTSLMAYSNPRPSGIIAILIDEDDELIAARLTDGKQQLFLMSKQGKCTRIDEREIRPMGRASRGVRGMKVGDSELVGMDVIGNEQSMLVVTAKGFGKRSANSEYRVQGRGGKGVINLRITERNGEVVGFRQVTDDDQVIVITDKGRLIRTNVAEVSMKGRVTQGVKLMDLLEDERAMDMTVVIESDEPDEEE